MLCFQKGALFIGSAYQFIGNFGYFEAPPFFLKSHLLGITINYTLNEHKKFSPFVGMSALTEIATNYKGQFIRDDFFPTVDYYKDEVFTGVSLDTYGPSVWYHFYNANLYEGTVLSAIVSAGYSYQPFPHFKIRMSLADAIKIMKKKSLRWTVSSVYSKEPVPNNDVREMVAKEATTQRTINRLKFQLSIQYSFDSKKKN